MTSRCAFLAFFLVATSALGQDHKRIEPDELPAELKPFVEKGTLPIFFDTADLNVDGRADYILVLEKQKANASDPDIEDGQRPLLVIVQSSDGKLQSVKRNEKAVYCSTCGGVMGDPFDSVRVEKGAFTVVLYGGSSWRWGSEYRFGYSRRDNTWQLVQSVQTNYHASDPKNGTRDVYTPPKDYGKIDIADFDPDNYLTAKK